MKALKFLVLSALLVASSLLGTSNTQKKTYPEAITKEKKIKTLKNKVQRCAILLSKLESLIQNAETKQKTNMYERTYIQGLLKKVKKLKIRKLRLEFELAIEEENYENAELIIVKLQNAGETNFTIQQHMVKVQHSKNNK